MPSVYKDCPHCSAADTLRRPATVGRASLVDGRGARFSLLPGLSARHRAGAQNWAKVSPSAICGAPIDAPGRFVLTHSPARRVDSWVPAWLSQTVTLVTVSPARVA